MERERIQRSVKHRDGKHRAFKLIVTTPGEIQICQGSVDGHQADLIEAPAGTKVQPAKCPDCDKRA